jgi:hypothetical protein
MNIRGLSVALFATLIFPAVSNAQDQWNAQKRVRDVSVRTIERAIQCEIGHFAREVQKWQITITSERSKAAYSLSEKIANTGGYDASVKLADFLHAGGNATEGSGIEDTIEFDPYTISVRNEDACSKRDDALVLLDLRECLARAAEVYDHSNFTCNAQINVKKDISGGVGLPVYLVTIGAGGSWEAEYSQGVKVVAPKMKPSK